jgi:hypothetical protein
MVNVTKVMPIADTDRLALAGMQKKTIGEMK